MSVKCCLTTLRMSPSFKVALKHWRSWCWMLVCPDGGMSLEDTVLNQSCRSTYKWTVHVFTLRLPQQNQPEVKITLDWWVRGTRGVLVTTLRHELLSSHFMNTHNKTFLFFLLGASVQSNEAGSGRQCFCWHLQDLTKLLPRLHSFMLPSLGSLGSLTFLWLTADNYDYLFKFA